MSNKPQVLIVGGGVFGSCCAYELAKAGVPVTIVERDPVGSHASGRNPGNLNPILATPAKLRPLALASFSMHLQMHAELTRIGCTDHKLLEVRRILVCFNETDRRQLMPVLQLFKDQPGFSTSWVEAQELRRIEPRLSRDVESGLLISGNRSLDALAFHKAILKGARKHGAHLFTGEVKEVTPNSRRFTVHTDRGNLDCDTLVLANGPWAGEESNWLGIALPIVPMKGEMLRIRLSGLDITHDFTHGEISLYRRREGEVWIGVTREPKGYDEQPSVEAMNLLLQGGSKILPAIAGAEVLEHLAALRPMAPGGLPLIGSVPGHGNLYIANGGGIKGMLLCVGVGRAIRDLILDGTTSLPVDEFDLRRA